MPQPPPVPYPIGPVLTNTGVHFTLYSKHATAVDLCLFETASSETESQRIALEKGADSFWRIHVPNLKAGCLYGYRVHGSYRPAEGHRFNPSKFTARSLRQSIGTNPAMEPCIVVCPAVN